LRAFILAGGKATRLYPMTLIMPKQLIMINGYPVIKYILDHCMKNDINEIVLCISDNSFVNQFQNALSSKLYPNLTIDFSIAPESFKTGGRLLAAKEFMQEDDFVIYYGDIITDFNLRSMINFHKKQSNSGCACTLATVGTKELECGVALQKEKISKVTFFKERPIISDISDFKINVGISVCNKSVLQFCQENSDFYSDVIPKLIKDGAPIYGYEVNKPFIDIGTLKAIEDATRSLNQNTKKESK
jgi:NDP-sugar pyrophosphorylase family protein